MYKRGKMCAAYKTNERWETNSTKKSPDRSTYYYIIC